MKKLFLTIFIFTSVVAFSQNQKSLEQLFIEADSSFNIECKEEIKSLENTINNQNKEFQDYLHSIGIDFVFGEFIYKKD